MTEHICPITAVLLMTATKTQMDEQTSKPVLSVFSVGFFLYHYASLELIYGLNMYGKITPNIAVCHCAACSSLTAELRVSRWT